MKKLFAIALCLVLVLSVFTGCPAKGGDKGGANIGADGRQIITIGLLDSVNVEDYDTNAFTLYLEEQTGYDIQFHKFASSLTDANTQLTTMLIDANSTLPDILWGFNLKESVWHQYGKDGYLADLTDYFYDENGEPYVDGPAKNFWDRVNNELSEEDRNTQLRRMTEPDTGSVFSLPGIQTSLIDPSDFQVWINHTWMDRLQLENPTNIDELYTVLKAFKTQDANGNGNKDDEIPLFGSQNGHMGSDVINWLLNFYVYVNDAKMFNVDENGQLYLPFVTDEYREGLKFINKLVKEGLMPQTCWTAGVADVRNYAVPAAGNAICGIFVGHLTLHANTNSPVLYEYEPLNLFGNAVRNENLNRRDTFITEGCSDINAAFRLCMEMYTYEASVRMRYGKYGENWVEADEGSLTALGDPAKIKVLDDPWGRPGNVVYHWTACTFLADAEGESNQVSEEQSEWIRYRTEIASQQYKNYMAAAENNKDVMTELLVLTTEEQDETYAERRDVAALLLKARTEFGTGTRNPNSDTDWNNYLKELEDLGLDVYMDIHQTVYDRQTKG